MKTAKVFAAILFGVSVLLTSCQKEPEPISVTGISLDSSSLTLIEGETARITATISPSNADNQGVIWSSSNASVASVNNGTIIAVSAGSATITAKSDDGGKTATCNITVNSKIVAVTGVSLDKTSLELTEGDEYTLVATVQPANASNKQVSWKSDDETVATVLDGKVKAIKPGNTSITVTTSDGNKTASCSIIVNEKIYHVESVILDKSSLELMEGGEYTLVATIAPSNATDKSLTWSSSDSSVAAVDQDGKVTALYKGSATISVSSHDGGKIATCTVTVNAFQPEIVDLGLSVKWASCNLGASKPEEYGDYYAWGETETKTSYTNNTYKFYKSEDGGGGFIVSGLTKYVSKSYATRYGLKDFYDDKAILDPEDDVAHVKLGGKWRIPTDAEYKELLENCQCEWVTYKGVNGIKITSKISGYTDKWIFLPAAGHFSTYSKGNVGSSGSYWSSSLYPSNLMCAWKLSFMRDLVYRTNASRCLGDSIRPVCD